MSVRIAVDANEAFRPRLTGFGVYARNLVRQFSSIASGDKFFFLGIRSGEMDTACVPPDMLRLLRSPKYRSVWSQMRLPLHLCRQRYDLFHSLEHKLPWSTWCPTVVTIHDLGFMRFPDMAPGVHRERFIWFTRGAIRRATRIIAISDSAKRDICEVFHTPPEKIDVVHHGVDHSVYRPDVESAKRSAPYVLCVGSIHPRKNYLMLIRAFKRLCDVWPSEIELLIVGKRAWMWEGIEQEARKPPFEGRVRFVGYVPDDQMPGLYAGAMLFAMPSLYEGFGIPALEAMACGVPVLAARTSSLPEVVGDAARLLDPEDEAGWTEAMLELLKSPGRRAAMREHGLVRAAGFSWER